MYSGHSSHTNPELGVDPDEPEDITEAVCLESALQDGQMMEVEVGHHNVLLAKCDGVYHAVGNQCTHYGGPLSKGALMGNKIRCPWHGSCFSVLTGDMEEFPAMDGLPKHKVKVEDSKVYVSINKKCLKQNKRMKKMCGRTPGNAHTIMLLGGGSASLICAETLRQEKYDGRIIMVTRDDLMPYDKTRLSKVMNAESSSIMLRKHEFYHQYDIEMWLRKEALSINTEKQTVTFNDGITQCYDQLLIATGCRAKPLDIPGADLEDVMMLEVPADAQRVHYACIKRRIVLVGTSFVGMEIAAYMIDRASSITVIGSSEMPYHKTFGPEIGKFTMTLLEEKGVKFYMNDFVKEIRGEDKKVKDIVLKSGTIIPTDVVIVGIGVLPNSECLQGSDVILDAKRFVPVDKYMRTNVPNVFCGGDVSTFPLKMANDQRVNIGHWQQAQAHGRVAALNMLQKEVPLNSVPVYWTVLLGMTIRYAGFGEGYTELEVKGNVKEMKFLALYIKEDRVVAAASLNFDPAVSVVAERLATGNTITKAEAKSDDLAWLHLPDPHQS